ncbi:AMP-binding protein [Aeromicrobium sp. CF4.19]|uniref:AMP-binding protein n=1 Tax=Aeromicrobium sp. CF4.19 TaxID=3373082 RepID=UPI003EE792D7
MPSLGFAMLDQHVVAGRADAPAVDVGGATMTFARLLERTAAVAGGLQVLGLAVGGRVAVDLPPSPDLVTVVCACLRLGAVPGGSGPLGVIVVDGVVTVTIEGQEPLDLATLRRAGGSDPAGALADDEPGFRAAAQERHGQVVVPLLAGRPVTFD